MSPLNTRHRRCSFPYRRRQDQMKLETRPQIAAQYLGQQSGTGDCLRCSLLGSSNRHRHLFTRSAITKSCAGNHRQQLHHFSSQESIARVSEVSAHRSWAQDLGRQRAMQRPQPAACLLGVHPPDRVGLTAYHQQPTWHSKPPAQPTAPGRNQKQQAGVWPRDYSPTRIQRCSRRRAQTK
jgi:hypothetical protein